MGLEKIFNNHEHANRATRKAINIYNNKRPHASCDYLTPEQAHKERGELNKRREQFEITRYVNKELNTMQMI